MQHTKEIKRITRNDVRDNPSEFEMEEPSSCPHKGKYDRLQIS